ncbi:MAG TPA: hypothetical protein VL371_02180 [Gemmataceae bacterium]|nr:hypothetical protein [Gemmataceae bacterium]
MRRYTATLATLALSAGPALAQFGRGAGEYNTAGGDAQRSGWVRTDAKISGAAMAKPGFAFLWKQKLDSAPRQQNNLTQTLVMGGYIGYRGFRTLGFVAGASDKVYGLDVDLGRVEWNKSVSGGGGAGTATCPGGLTANVARVLAAAFPQASGGQGFGGGGRRGGPAKSDVGAPGEGAALLKTMAAPAAAPGGRGGRGAPGPGGFPRRQPNYLYVLGGDGLFHSMYVSNGEEPNPAVKFIGPNANAQGLIVSEGMAYVATSGNCGGVSDGVWGLELESKQVTNWTGKIAGSAGPVLGPDGTVYVSTTGGDLVALEPKTL